MKTIKRKALEFMIKKQSSYLEEDALYAFCDLNAMRCQATARKGTKLNMLSNDNYKWYKITDKPTRKELHAEIAKLNKIINKKIDVTSWLSVKSDYDQLMSNFEDLEKSRNRLKESLEASQEHNKELEDDLKAHEIVTSELASLLDDFGLESINDLRNKLSTELSKESLQSKIFRYKRKIKESERRIEKINKVLK